MDELSIFVGYDTNTAEAFDICRHAIKKHASKSVDVIPLRQDELREKGLYWREPDVRASNQFSMTRWLTPCLSSTRFALFVDCDMLFTQDVFQLLERVDPNKAVHLVKHDYQPKQPVKMAQNGQVQKQHCYPRKNWSSLVLWNCEHPRVAELTPGQINQETPKHWHRFEFLDDASIGDIGAWTSVFASGQSQQVPLVNFLVGEYPKPNQLPFALHYTLGIPEIHDQAACSRDYYDLWLQARDEYWASRIEEPVKVSELSPL